MFLLPNLVKFSYGWSPLEQHHKIEKERKKEKKPYPLYNKKL
jgi:hypothetical protein